MKPWKFILLMYPLTACVPSVETAEEAKPFEEIRNFFEPDNAFVFTRDRENTTGAGAIVNLASLELLEEGLGQGDWLSNDISLNSDSRYIYAIDRMQANFTIIDPLDSSAPLRQISTGTGTNPAAVVRINNKLYVSRYDSASMLVLDANDYREAGTIDLSAYKSPVDDFPEMGNAVSAEGKVWVLLERLDRLDGYYWPPSATDAGSYIVSIDPQTDTIADSIKLLGVNPYQFLKIDPLTGYLYTASTLNSQTGIELIDPKTATSKGWLINPEEFPNGINFAAATTTHVMVASGENFDPDTWEYEYTYVTAVDRRSGERTELFRTTEGYFGIVCLDVSPQKFVVTCSGPDLAGKVVTPGLRIFDAGTLQEVKKIDFQSGFGPMGIAFFSRPATEVVSVPATAATK